MTVNLKFISCIFVCFIQAKCLDIDLHHIHITGPGLKPDLVMPARYFFIYLYENSIMRYDSTAAENLKVDISGINNFQRNCRVWTNILDRKDGSFIVRYKLYESCNNMEINVMYNGDHVGGSPFKINSMVLADDCYCPVSIDKWLINNNCSASYPQINKDLQPFTSINFSDFHEFVVNKVGDSGSMSVCNYVILRNEIYRKCYGQHVGFKTFMDAILTSLARKVELPDIELFVNLGDWPLVQRNVQKVYPLFSWCGSKNTLDIVIPTYDITDSTLEAMGRVSLDMLSVQGNIDLPWESREPKAFWRGRDSSRERLKLIEIARKNPDLFNASLTNFFFFRDQEHIYGPKEKHISFFNFFDYKYQVCLDGTVAAYRLPYLLAGGSLVMKQDSPYYEHFYSDLVPWKHFVPIKRDLSDLVEKVVWAREHDEEAHKIATAGQKFARENLLPEHIFCYHTQLLKEWSKRITENPKIREGMEKVPQPKQELNCCANNTPDPGSLNSHSEL